MADLTPKSDASDNDRMRDTVARFEQRRRRWRTEGARTLVLAVTVAGMGWTIVVPAVVGFVSGHWLDRRYGTGIVLGAGLGLLGLVLGCRGFASTGPHRDDLALTLGDHPVRGMASQGQQRAVVLALQLGEVGAWRYIARQ